MKLADELDIMGSLGELIVQMGQNLNLKRGEFVVIDDTEDPITYGFDGQYFFPNGVKLEYSAICDEDEHHFLRCRIYKDGELIDEKTASELCDRTFMYLILEVLKNWFEF